jgi:hypothetical protein
LGLCNLAGGWCANDGDHFPRGYAEGLWCGFDRGKHQALRGLRLAKYNWHRDHRQPNRQ